MNVLKKIASVFNASAGDSTVSANVQQTAIEAELSERIRHFLPSYLLSLDDEPYKPSDRLIQLLLASVKLAWEDEMEDLQHRIQEPEKTFIRTFPGEHYRLLKAITKVLKPKTVIEIGTYRGLGCLTLKSGIGSDARVITYDIFPWEEIPGSHLRKEDWDESLQFRRKDLCNPEDAADEWNTLISADLIFVDAAKDGHMEREFINLFYKVPFLRPPVIIFDDIRFPEMCMIWRDIKKPKLDVTSFGHWSGTGLIDWIPSELPESSGQFHSQG
jgi:predicted O-methyltransferase YrrM